MHPDLALYAFLDNRKRKRPKASFSSDADGLTVTFTDTSTKSPTSWLWDFGDGETSTEENPEHEYAEAGTYTVTLIARNRAGEGRPASTDIVVENDAPVNTTPPILGANPVVGTQLAYTPGVWTDAISVSAQAQRRLSGGAWVNVGAAWDAGSGTPYTPVDGDVFYTFRVVETATPGATTAVSNETNQASGPMTFQVTTTAPSQTLTIQGMTVSASVNINWGDASSDNYTGSGLRSHVYASAGTYTVTLDLPLNVTVWDFRDTKLSGATGSKFSYMQNLTSLTIILFGTTFAWTVGASAPMPMGLTTLNLQNIGTGFVWTVGTSAPMPAGLTNLTLVGIGTGFAWTVGTSAPMPAGLTILNLLLLSPGLVFDASFAFGLPLVTLRIESSLSQAQVDLVLEKLYAVFPTRTGTNGTIDLLGGSNAAPSGILQAACPPTTGNERAFELVNDTCGVSPRHWASVTVQT